ncbi:polyketide synthase [Penicillium antarcticum]|nr:polyketide synthase [Penicillium antarcticum]KAJ5319929.1 polyketide synthase [Penicillium antarcticum]
MAVMKASAVDMSDAYWSQDARFGPLREASSTLAAEAPDKFQMDGVSVARHEVDSMIGVELQTWLFKEFGVQISVQVLSNPNTTFRSLASLVAEHIYVAA